LRTLRDTIANEEDRVVESVLRVPATRVGVDPPGVRRETTLGSVHRDGDGSMCDESSLKGALVAHDGVAIVRHVYDRCVVVLAHWYVGIPEE
jgi:hypothetical protein